jgi:L-aminopeptidase/D-esterase-like protein
MTQIQHIQQQFTQSSRALNTWSDSLCGDIILGFSTYNNEPKQGGTEV